ncbi:hypothetical protein Agabi119p4_7462 [Agaricus bisporus var. burnettii]|uniref:Uncharacterized protein n=1 Tax=Agaricus bisporus var. burnettii TaxID=192524 RepID=A0A8H7C6X3_AGABI|nr:hypothetical protein Agabi119p4_7462 [Agaricus bisporus var. burnettii]
MLPPVLKHRFGLGFFSNLLPKGSMSSSFYAQELNRALREQGPAIHCFRVVNATSLQAVAHVKVLEGHSIGVVLTQQGYKIDAKLGEGPSQVFETIEDLLHSINLKI